MARVDPTQQFHDPNSRWYWWWQEEKARSAWFGKPWRFKTNRQKLRELGAFRFELARRSERNLPSVPYPQAYSLTRDMLEPGPNPLLFGVPAEMIQDGDFIRFPALAFCIHAPRTQILERVREMIDGVCSKRGIKLPQRHVNVPNHPRKWQLIELLDRSDICKEKMLPGERSQLSDLRKEAKTLAKTFRRFQMGRASKNSADRRDPRKG